MNKEMVLKIFALIAALAMILSLSACGKNESEDIAAEPPTVKDDNVPDNVVPPITQPAPEVTASPDITDAPETAPSEENDAPESEAEPDSQPVQTEPTETVDDKEDLVDRYATRALMFLDILNSNRVHTKFVEVSSFDGENVFSIGREAFIDGNNRVYISDSVRTFYRGGTVTYVDYDEGIYYSYSEEGDFGLTFGYASDRYTLISTEETDSGFSEIYSISGEDMTSTWTFSSDGTLIRVADRSLDVGYFILYSFEVIETDVSGMDFTIPEGFVEVDPDDYEFLM